MKHTKKTITTQFQPAKIIEPETGASTWALGSHKAQYAASLHKPPQLLQNAQFYSWLTSGRLQLKCDGTRWRTGGEVKGKLVNGVDSQYSSHYLGTWCIQHYYRWCSTPRLPVVDWTDAPADLNGLVRFAERWNLVSVRVPSHFKRSLLSQYYRKYTTART